jgi:hypothetical protein
MVPSGEPGPVDMEEGSITITIGEHFPLQSEAVEISTSLESVAGRQGVPVTRFVGTWVDSLAPGSYPVTLSFEDAYGNVGGASAELVVE